MKPLTPAEKDFLNLMKVAARDAFGTLGFISPSVISMQPGGEYSAVSVAGKPHYYIGALIGVLKTVGPCVLMLEAWMIKFFADDRPALAEAIREGRDAIPLRPSDDPERTESVIIQYWHQKRHILVHGTITRPKDGPPLLGPWSTVDNEDPESVLRPHHFGDKDQVPGFGPEQKGSR